MIEKINIKNFKSIKNLEIQCNHGFNVIIGENNIGKTSIFEAIHLWKICYDANIQKSNKDLFYSAPKNITFADNEFLRVFEDQDLINNELYRTTKDITIALAFNLNDRTFDLGFIITKVSSIDNAYLQVSYLDKQPFMDFSVMVKQTSYNLSNIMLICESRPIANIVAKEPYMYKSQVIDKISRGKGYEVLRNKIIKSQQMKENIETHISNVMNAEYKFSEIDKDNKTYVRLLVNGTNILSQGSGFLQIAEIFSSLEYTDSGRYILLIDEPDSHLHMTLQRNLIEEFKQIENSQLFIITHNDKFLNYIPDEEILYIDSNRKASGRIGPIARGYKNLIIKGLSGTIERIDELRNAIKVILCEGQTDVEFLNALLRIMVGLTGRDIPCLYIEKLCGIDTLNDKLLSYSRAYANIVSLDAEWLILRDSDCLPISKQSAEKRKSLTYVTATRKDVIYQRGYGVESTFVSEIDKFSDLIIRHYELDPIELPAIKGMIELLNQRYTTAILTITDPIHKELETHFNRQKSKRPEYKDLVFRDMLLEIDETNIEYAMTKAMLDKYLMDLHQYVVGRYTVQSDALNHSIIMTFYLGSIRRVEDFYDCHKTLIDQILAP
ncbi:ATP-dependent nuclease [Anaerospora hongkongensis]|uniref:ATP-dependent nuclease n=1 Tax=Anaerospora hongkongensis TaxID=244830 RepID=UPI00289AEF7C|nr:AAA family ATPase [Anaerospora hongkongensis]